MAYTKENRPKLARKRLESILTKHGIANARTLEQKISDAGPRNQRIDPHILTPTIDALVQEGRIIRIEEGGAPWFHLPNTSEATVEKRLEEQLPIFQSFQRGTLGPRMGQCLEIAIYRALCHQDTLDFLGNFPDLKEHEDSRLYSKEEPQKSLNGKSLPGDQRLDFLIRHPEAGWAGIEAKNVRQWLYPDRSEITDLLGKAVALDCVPVLIARRFPFVAFKILSACGVVFHQNYNQLLPEADRDLAEKAKHKRLLGYHDIRVGNQPNDRLIKFVTTNLPQNLLGARERFNEHKDLLAGFANDKNYKKFAALVKQRSQGTYEESDLEPPDDYG